MLPPLIYKEKLFLCKGIFFLTCVPDRTMTRPLAPNKSDVLLNTNTCCCGSQLLCMQQSKLFTFLEICVYLRQGEWSSGYTNYPLIGAMYTILLLLKELWRRLSCWSWWDSFCFSEKVFVLGNLPFLINNGMFLRARRRRSSRTRGIFPGISPMSHITNVCKQKKFALF